MGENDEDFIGSLRETSFKSITILEGSSRAYELIKATLSRLNVIFKFPDSSSEIFPKDTRLEASNEIVKMQRIARRYLNLFIFIISFNTGFNISILAFY